MENYRLTRKADNDLPGLYEYGILNFGLSQAQSYLLGLYECLEHLANSPLGRDANELSPGLKRLIYEFRVIFYKPEETGILVIRILRGEMDFNRHI